MEQMVIVEMEDGMYGYRFWSDPMPASAVDGYVAEMVTLGYIFSDEDYPA